MEENNKSLEEHSEKIDYFLDGERRSLKVCIISGGISNILDSRTKHSQSS